MMNLIQVNRILDAVGPEHFPEGFDREELSRGLDLCARWYREALRYSTRKSELLGQGRLAAISKTAKRLHLLLDDEGRAQELNGSDTLLAPKIHETQKLLGTLIEAAEKQLLRREKQSGPHAAYQRNFRKWSPFEWLVGRWLPLVYMEIGMFDPGSLAALAAKDSPYVRFVMAALTELSISNGGNTLLPFIGHQGDAIAIHWQSSPQRGWPGRPVSLLASSALAARDEAAIQRRRRTKRLGQNLIRMSFLPAHLHDMVAH